MSLTHMTTSNAFPWGRLHQCSLQAHLRFSCRGEGGGTGGAPPPVQSPGALEVILYAGWEWGSGEQHVHTLCSSSIVHPTCFPGIRWEEGRAGNWKRLSWKKGDSSGIITPASSHLHHHTCICATLPESMNFWRIPGVLGTGSEQ